MKKGKDGVTLYSGGTGKRILIAEDIEINREIIREILKQTGADVEFAEDGEICIRMIQDKPVGYYNMVLMDTSNADKCCGQKFSRGYK